VELHEGTKFGGGRTLQANVVYDGKEYKVQKPDGRGRKGRLEQIHEWAEDRRLNGSPPNKRLMFSRGP